jgi:hypothetical protein
MTIVTRRKPTCVERNLCCFDLEGKTGGNKTGHLYQNEIATVIFSASSQRRKKKSTPFTTLKKDVSETGLFRQM